MKHSFSRSAWDSALRLSTYGAQEKRPCRVERSIINYQLSIINYEVSPTPPLAPPLHGWGIG